VTADLKLEVVPQGGSPLQAQRRAAEHEVWARPRLDERLTSLVSPESFEAEQYRVLRHALEQVRRAPGEGAFGITSPGAGDGKTTTALNLAGALAQDPEARVLLVDGDLRRASVSASLRLDDGRGLAEAAAHPGVKLERVVRRLSHYNLSVLPAGRSASGTYETLRSARTGELLAQAREQYDFVLIDMPPVLLVPDCRVLSKWVDSFLLVVRAHVTPRKLVQEALAMMGPAKLLGLVFNGDQRPLYGYYGHYKNYYGRQRAARASWWRSLFRSNARRGAEPRG
jgi:capsular exopolysaccharide synthesis family protein